MLLNKLLIPTAKILTSVIVSVFLASSILTLTNQPVRAATCTDPSSQLCLNSLPGSTKNNATQGEIQTILSIVFGAMGSVALLMVVLAGFKYVTSSGEPQELSKAKNSLIYAAVGLIVSVLAFTLVTFVINSV